MLQLLVFVRSAAIPADSVCFDLLGRVQSVSCRRSGGANREAATLTLIDRSSVDGDKVAAVEISLFQGADQDEKLIDQAEQFQDKVIIVIGVRSKYNASKTPPLALTSSYTSKLFLAPEGAAEVKAMAAMEMQNVETQKIAAHSNAGRDWEAETYLVTCNWLRRVEGPATDHLYQVNFATLDVPVGADSIRTKDGSRIWFSSQLRDITGSVTVWVSEEAALAINSDDNLSAQLFEEAWQQRDLRFLVANVKLCRWPDPVNRWQGCCSRLWRIHGRSGHECGGSLRSAAARGKTSHPLQAVPDRDDGASGVGSSICRWI